MSESNKMLVLAARTIDPSELNYGLVRELADALAALDGEWQSERPTPGLWWVAIAPDKRSDLSFWSGTDPIKDVWVAKSGEVFQGNTHLSDELLTGALWQRRTVPGDPFKGGGE